MADYTFVKRGLLNAAYELATVAGCETALLSLGLRVQNFARYLQSVVLQHASAPTNKTGQYFVIES